MKATRDWFGEALADIAARDTRIVVVNCDLASATKTGTFKEAFPRRFIECGIAEANAIGIAAGLAQEGLRPFVASFGHFLTGKYLEIFQSIGLNDSGVVLVGTHAGLAIGKDGPTQMGLRDLALMRSLPNVQILHPGDGAETRAMLQYLATSSAPAYLRLCRQPQPEVHEPGYRFRMGEPDVVRRGADLVVVSMGGLVKVVLDAVGQLAADGIDATVVNLSSLPPDQDRLGRVLQAHHCVYVAEDHYIRGGISDEVARVVGELGLRVRFGSLGVPDYGQAAAPEELYERYELNADGICRRLRAFLRPSDVN